MTPYSPAEDLIVHFARSACPGDLLESHPNVYGVLSVGFDHTETACNGSRIDEPRSIALLEADVVHTWDKIISPLLVPRVRAELNMLQRAAIISFAHSIGRRNFIQTTALARLNSRRYLDVPAEMIKHSEVNGKTMRILVRRRLSESNLFCSFPGWLVPP